VPFRIGFFSVSRFRKGAYYFSRKGENHVSISGRRALSADMAGIVRNA
jgi:hypothetical protein